MLKCDCDLNLRLHYFTWHIKYYYHMFKTLQIRQKRQMYEDPFVLSDQTEPGAACELYLSVLLPS